MAQDRSAYPQSERECPEHEHELRDLKVSVVAVLTVFSLLMAVVIQGALWGWFKGFKGHAAPAQNGPWQVLAPDSPAAAQGFPALQLHPARDLRDFARENARRLQSYGWIDPAHGVIQLPVQRAMQLIVAQGLPEWPVGNGPARFDAASNTVEDLDAAFLKKMAQSSLADIEFGGMAQTRGQAGQFIDIGKKLADENRKLLEDITDTARAIGAGLPQQPGLADQVAAKKMRGMQGNEFEQALARQLVADTAQRLEELRESADHLTVPRVKNLASHLEEKTETEMEDVRDAAEAVGLSEGTILEIIEQQKSAVRQEQTLGPHESSVAEQNGGEEEPPPETTASASPNGGKGSSETNGQPAHPDSPDLEYAFLLVLAHAAVAGEQLGSLGAQRAQNGDVVKLSRGLIQNSDLLRSQLRESARKLGVKMPDEAGLNEQLALERLRRAGLGNFDQELARAIVAEEAILLQETRNCAGCLQNPNLKELAQRTISTFQQRLAEARQAAEAAGVQPEAVERIVVAELMAAGAPFPIMAGAEIKPENEEGAAQRSGGKTNGATAGTAPTAADAPAVSPLQLQQQRANQPEENQ